MYGSKRNITSLYTFESCTQALDVCKKYITKDSKVVLALSGGVDSTLLFEIVYDFFITQDFSLKNLIVVHMNHKSRTQSDIEEQEIIRYCTLRGVIVCAASFFGSTHTETSFRKARKGFIENSIGHIGSGDSSQSVVYLTGHHLDDRIETTLLHQQRGSGLRGSINMTTSQNKFLRPFGGGVLQYVHLRPLLGMQKKDIIKTSKQLEITYFEDTTNADPVYTKRNALRKKLATTLTPKEYDGYIAGYMAQEKEYNALLEKVAIQSHTILWSHVQEYYSIGLVSTITTLQYVLDLMGIYQNISRAFLEEMLSFLHKSQGYKYVRGWYVWRCHGKTYLIKGSKKFREEDVLLPYPHKHTGILRASREGDTYRGKTFRTFLGNQKIPTFLRNHMPVIEKNGVIVATLYHKDLLHMGYL